MKKGFHLFSIFKRKTTGRGSISPQPSPIEEREQNGIEEMPENMEEIMARKKEVELTEEQKAEKATAEEFIAFVKKTGIANPKTAAYLQSLEKRIAALEE